MPSSFARVVALPLLASCVVFAPGARAATYLVGSGTGCTHATIQAAIDSATANPGPDIIRVTRSRAYTGIALQQTDQDLSFQGRWPACDSAARDATLTVLNGDNLAPVWTISGGGTVAIDGFQITGGNTPAGGSGGGMRIRQAGSGSVYLVRMQFNNNNADRGGALSVSTDAPQPSGGSLLALGEQVSIRFNQARSDGGGIYCHGARVHGVADGIELALNQAVRHGGGIAADRCQLELSSPGGAFPALFFGNSAGESGGAIWLLTSEALVYTSDGANPLRFSGNSAANGGAVAVIGQSFFTGLDTRFDANRAYVGGAVFHQFNNLPLVINRVQLLRRNGSGPGTDCNAPACGTLHGNVARSADDLPRIGAIVRASAIGGGDIVETRFARQEMEGNEGTSLFRGNEVVTAIGTQRLVIENSLVHHNRPGSGGIAYAAAGGVLDVIASTIADNGLGAQRMFRMEHNAANANRLRIRNSAFVEDAGSTLSGLSGVDLEVDHLRIQNRSGLETNPTVVTSTPGFVAPALHDYRPGPESALRDRAPLAAGSYSDALDLLGSARAIDLAPVANGAGLQDLGAIEAIEALPLAMFLDGFE